MGEKLKRLFSKATLVEKEASSSHIKALENLVIKYGIP